MRHSWKPEKTTKQTQKHKQTTQTHKQKIEQTTQTQTAHTTTNNSTHIHVCLVLCYDCYVRY